MPIHKGITTGSFNYQFLYRPILVASIGKVPPYDDGNFLGPARRQTSVLFHVHRGGKRCTYSKRIISP